MRFKGGYATELYSTRHVLQADSVTKSDKYNFPLSWFRGLNEILHEKAWETLSKHHYPYSCDVPKFSLLGNYNRYSHLERILHRWKIFGNNWRHLWLPQLYLDGVVWHQPAGRIRDIINNLQYIG